jgi:hypothetical protein
MLGTRFLNSAGRGLRGLAVGSLAVAAAVGLNAVSSTASAVGATSTSHRAARTAVVVAAPLAAAGGGRSASTPAESCGFTLGPINGQGAAGTLYFAVALEALSPAESCTVPVTFQASITMASGVRYTDIDNDPMTNTETVSFVPGRVPPALTVGWSGFHCADPAVPGVLTFTVGGQHASVGVAPSTCGTPGSHSSLEGATFQPISEVGIAPTDGDRGYVTVDQLGNITTEGDAAQFLDVPASAPAVGIAPASAGGVWIVASDGGVFTDGNARFHGSLGNVRLNAPVVGIAATPDGGGYWLAASDGGVFAFGDARFHGSLGTVHLNSPVVGIAATPDGGGYWLVASDGGVFAFGDARFHGSLGAVHLDAPVVGMAADGRGGYWLVASDGGVFAYGGAPFKGSMGGVRLDADISGMAATSSGEGYWLVGSDNGVFNFGDAKFFGSGVEP